MMGLLDSGDQLFEFGRQVGLSPSSNTYDDTHRKCSEAKYLQLTELGWNVAGATRSDVGEFAWPAKIFGVAKE